MVRRWKELTTGRFVSLLLGLTIIFTGMVFGEGVRVIDFLTCEEVIQGTPQNSTTVFGNDTKKMAVFMRLANVYESLEISWEWTHISGQERLTQTQMIPSPGEQGYDFWEEYLCWGTLDLSGMTPEMKS